MMLCSCAYASVHTGRLTLINKSCKTGWISNIESKSILVKEACSSKAYSVSDSMSFISPVTVPFPKHVIESKTDFFACEQLSSHSLAIISLLRIFCTIWNSTYQLLSFLRIGTQAPTFAFFCTRKALPAKEVSQKMHFIFLAPPRLLWAPSTL